MRSFEPMECALLAVAFLAPAVIALFLTPAPRGFGTHCQLGLPPCVLRTFTGVPCPFCGMTTAFALAAHGRVVDAFLTQPVGALLFPVTILAGLFLLACAVGRRSLPDPRVTERWRQLEWGLATFLLLGWAYKIWRTFA